MLIQKINHFHAPKISIQIFLAFRLEQVFQQQRRVRALGNRFQELWCGMGDGIVAQKRFAKAFLSFCRGDRLISLHAERANDFLN